MYKKIINIINNHNDWRKNCINLIASENAMSPLAQTALLSDMGNRYFFNDIFKTQSGITYEYSGTKYISELIKYAEEIAKELFSADYVNLDMLSGHLSNISLLVNNCKANDSIICTNPDYGGYPGLARENLPSKLGINVYFYNQTPAGNIDDDAFCEQIIKIKPKIVMFTSSIILFPISLTAISAICRENNVILAYDASHSLGLIAGGQFQQPLKEDADILLGSTHKTFPGPQGGIILSNRHQPKLNKPFIVTDNTHLNRIAALTITLAEMKEFGRDYAKQTIKNSRHLAKSLEDVGISIAFREKNYSNSHQILFSSNPHSLEKFIRNLETANIILDNSGRIGTNEMTRFGMKESEMEMIAKLIGRIYAGENPQNVKKDVVEFRNDFNVIKYCF
ncbi:MAG: aminotransferase class I/II-fold pyridoxal phosphate-dependent enzyme [Melioribacteraceae bacterium]